MLKAPASQPKILHLVVFIAMAFITGEVAASEAEKFRLKEIATKIQQSLPALASDDKLNNEQVWKESYDFDIDPSDKVEFQVEPGGNHEPGIEAAYRSAFTVHYDFTAKQLIITLLKNSADKIIAQTGEFIDIQINVTHKRISSGIGSVSGTSGKSSCTQSVAFTTLARRTLRLKSINDKNHSVQYRFDPPENAEFLDSYRGEEPEFRTHNTIPTKVYAEYIDPLTGNSKKTDSAPLKICLDELPPPPPPPPPPALPETVNTEPPQIVPPLQPETPFGRHGFHWGASGSLGLGVFSDYSRNFIDTGAAFGLTARIGYYANDFFGFSLEPRFSLLGKQNSFVAYNFGLSLLLEFGFAKYFVAAVGPAIGLAGSDVGYAPGGTFAGGFSARIGVDYFLSRRPTDQTPRAVSFRLDVSPLIYRYTAADTNQYTGAVTTICLMVGYESY